MRRIAGIATLLLATACVKTQVESGPSPVRAAVAPESVAVLRSDAGIARFEEIATVRASGDGRYVGEVQLIAKLREQAGRLGANALIVDSLMLPSAGRALLGYFIGVTARAEGRAVHLLAPDESAATPLVARGPVVRAPGHEALVGRSSGQLAPRDRVRVSGLIPARVESARAVVLGASPDTLLLQFSGVREPNAVPMSSLRVVEVQRGRRVTGGRLATGMLAGAALGAGLNLVIAEAFNQGYFKSDEGPQYGRAAAIGAAFGALGGATYVALNPAEHWVRIR